MAPTANDDRLLDVHGVAARLGCGADLVYRLVRDDGLPSVKVGRLLRFRVASVDRWVAAREDAAAPTMTSTLVTTSWKGRGGRRTA